MDVADPRGAIREDPAVRTVSCDLWFRVHERAELVLQVVAAASAGVVFAERLEVGTGGAAVPFGELHGPSGGRLHVVHAAPGPLSVSYRGEIGVRPRPGPGPASPRGYDEQVLLRPSRYCPSDHLVGFAVAEFGTGPGAGERVARIERWIRERVGYVPGSSGVHDSAEDTLLTGVGTCRDFAHLGVALCRATGVPARFASVYAPGLAPMEFHAVFEAFEDGRWCAHDATGLAPRPAMVRIATGRDAADAAFAAVTAGIADLDAVEVSATVGGVLPADDHLGAVELA